MAISRTAITGPFHGIITDVPPCVDLQGFEDSVNFIGWKGRQRTRPGLNLAAGFSCPDGNPILNMTSFEDAENFLHTVGLSALNAYALLPTPALTPLTYPSQYITTIEPDAPGTGYLINDIINVVQAGASAGTAQITDVNSTTGAVLSMTLLTGGFVYSNATGVATSGGTGTGLTVTITVGALTSLGGLNATNLPYAVVKAMNRVYFCNGSVPLCYIDGEASFKVSGNVPGACRFLTANQNHLIGAAWTEPDPTQVGSIFYPHRVRWSDSDNYDQWDTSLDTSTAGVADIIDVPDTITGLSTLGTYSYIYRTNGINILQPTGSASIPFYIPNYSLSPKGEGCKYPYTLDTFSNVDRFVSDYDVCSFDGSNFKHLMEGKCASTFFADLGTAQGVVRGFHTYVLDNGFPFLGYVVTIPGANVAWVLNISEDSWNRWVWLSPTGTPGSYDLQFIEQVYLT